jgi:hypothetical protein
MNRFSTDTMMLHAAGMTRAECEDRVHILHQECAPDGWYIVRTTYREVDINAGVVGGMPVFWMKADIQFERLHNYGKAAKT